MVIDAHAHVFPAIQGHVAAGPTRGLSYGQAQIGSQTVRIMPSLNEQVIHTPQMLLSAMDLAGVDKAILLQGPFFGQCNGYVIEAIKSYPDRLAAAAYLDPWQPDAKDQLQWILEQQVFCALKLECSDATGLCGIHPGARLDDPKLKGLWQALADTDLSLTLDLGAIGASSYQTDAVRAIAQRHTAMHIIIAHMGQPKLNMNCEDQALWLEQIDLAMLPNVWLDTASLPAYVAPEPYPFPTVSHWLKQVIERIGPEKILYGTDTPGLLLHASYLQLLQAMKTALGFLSPMDQDKLFSINAKNAYGV